MDLEQVKDYLAYAWKHAWMVGIGVMCFILTPFLMTMYEEFEDLFSGSAAGEFFDAFSLFVFLCGIIAGVVFSVKAKQLRKENALPPNCHLILMEDALEYYKEQKKNEEGKRNCSIGSEHGERDIRKTLGNGRKVPQDRKRSCTFLSDEAGNLQ